MGFPGIETVKQLVKVQTMENVSNESGSLNPIKKMGGKPVFVAPGKTVINFKSGFGHKLLCDDATFTPGSACVYRCSFCYVESIILKNKYVRNFMAESGLDFQDIVVRRAGAIETIRQQLSKSDGSPRFFDLQDRRVIYASPLVDVAANIELANETAEMCLMILEKTNWQIRLLSKSPLLTKIADQIPTKWEQRVIYGFSSGTLDDQIAKSIEIGTPLVSRRIAALHELQDRGLRTYGMACPILPQADPRVYAARVVEALRLDRCEHLWAEPLNFRGASMIQTRDALRAAGQHQQSELFEEVCSSRDLWEQYARDMFLAFAEVVPAEKLRFLQYVRKETRDWWQAQEHRGAVILGRAAHGEVLV
jgi:DNA repair photolyase